MIATGAFHRLRRHNPIGRDLLTDCTVSPWGRLPRPGIHRIRSAVAAHFADTGNAITRGDEVSAAQQN